MSEGVESPSGRSLALWPRARLAILSPRARGGLLTLASAAALSVTFIASKQALRELTPLAFTPLWFGVASVWGAGALTLTGSGRRRASIRPHWRSLLLLGLLSGTANLLFFSAVRVGDPTLVALFSRSETLFTVSFGLVLLHERLSRRRLLGMAVALAGVGLMTFRAASIIWLMLLLSLGASFFHAATNFVAKRSVANVSPLLLSIARTAVMSIMLGTLGALSGQLAWPSPQALIWIVGGAFFGPFLSYLLYFRGMQSLDLGTGAIIRSSQPLFVALYSLMIFGALPGWQQLIGGAILVGGVVLLIRE